MDELNIRGYQSQDWNRLMDIHDNARRIELRLAGLDGAFIPLEVAAESEGLFEYSVCVAVSEGEVCGFVAFSNDELAWLYVDPTMSRQGIGRALASHAVANISDRPICVELLLGNDPALQLYLSLGFEVVEVRSGLMPGNEAFQVNVNYMERME